MGAMLGLVLKIVVGVLVGVSEGAKKLGLLLVQSWERRYTLQSNAIDVPVEDDRSSHTCLT